MGAEVWCHQGTEDVKIANAHDAFWFLHEHPRFECREAILLTEEQAKTLKLDKGERIRKIKDDMPWNKEKSYFIREFGLEREAMDCNLDIFYTKVDERRRVNDDKSKNVNVECWLGFGTIEQSVSDGVLHMTHYHDPDLDCGAPTFDEALVKLAKLVKRHYGGLKTTPKWLKP